LEEEAWSLPYRSISTAPGKNPGAAPWEPSPTPPPAPCWPRSRTPTPPMSTPPSAPPTPLSSSGARSPWSTASRCGEIRHDDPGPHRSEAPDARRQAERRHPDRVGGVQLVRRGYRADARRRGAFDQSPGRQFESGRGTHRIHPEGRRGRAIPRAAQGWTEWRMGPHVPGRHAAEYGAVTVAWTAPFRSCEKIVLGRR